jgi:hypothetical protein
MTRRVPRRRVRPDGRLPDLRSAALAERTEVGQVHDAVGAGTPDDAAHSGTRARRAGHEMLAEKIRVEASAVATTARWSVVVVLVCGGLGFAVGAERAIRADRMTEGVMLVIASAMATAVSLTVLLFVAWRTGPTSPPDNTAGSTARRSE